MRLPPFSFVVLDTETTGFVPKVHHVIEYAAMRAEGGEIVDTYEQLFAVEGEIPPHIQVLTRIKQDAIQNQPTFPEKLAEIEAKLQGVDMLVGQNLSFDIGMIRGEGIDLTNRPWVDTSILASLVFPEFRSYSLQYMSAQLKLNHTPAHRALGDVRATLELFGKIWERLLELPVDKMAFAKDVLNRSTEGYKILAAALPSGTDKDPSWIAPRARKEVKQKPGKLSIKAPPIGTVELQEEGLHSSCLQEIINAAAADDTTVHWIAVKNLEASLKRLHLPENVTVLHPPQLLLNPEAANALAKQEVFAADEATVLLKLTWWNPRTRNDIAVHGGEKDLWNGKLACAITSPAYTEQFTKKSSVFLLDHKQLLSFLADPKHAAHGALTNNIHIIVDDASMLEDTATKAYGHYASLDDLRAAAGTDEGLVSLTNVLAMFAEQVRNGEDQYFVTAGDLRRSEANALRERVKNLLTRADLPEKTLEQLRAVSSLLDMNLPEKQIVWIERRMDGALMMISAPKNVDVMLQTYLYDKHPTTLLVPKGGSKLPEIVAPDAKTHVTGAVNFTPCPLSIRFSPDQSITTFLKNPLPGKTILLAGSKRMIEQSFIVHTEDLESRGVTLICQGLSGGQNRMESDFIAAKSPAILMVTPFMYEGLDFPEGAADRLIIDTVPFDHPNNPVMSQRKNRYKSSFAEYALPRLEFRLFRLMRTFCRHKNDTAEILVFDKRLFEKDYGARIQRYMSQCATDAEPIVEAPPSAEATARTPKPKKPAAAKPKKDDGQLQLPL